ELGERFIAEYYKDADALGVSRASHNPRATEHIGDIIALVERLIAGGHAYATDEGDVYFSVRSYPAYGKLSGQNIDDLENGARVDPTERKRDPLDFALWKAEKPNEPSWDSPWGKGRPGWHVECSAMSMKILGESFDIHSGGQDLIFPHHENEIAQSEAATGKPFARYWLHNGYINIDNVKMSKSLGNFFTIRDIAGKFDLAAVRLFMLGVHYRNPVNYSGELIGQANVDMERLRTARERLAGAQTTARNGPEDAAFFKELDAYKDRFITAMDDDLNTADALGVLFELARACNTYVTDVCDAAARDKALALFDELTQVLGLLPKREEERFPQEALDLLSERQQARKEKNFARADAIRAELKEMGFAVEDTPQGPKLKKI
ncbi:MAG: cysteine--tRNA ligase, partial [Clostridiales bacterium]|nr:cysteine--tRNA ligase [Clostridiales bacterium]